jgi:acetolactate synthase-1/3 small subunit
MRRIISVLLENEPGALSRVVGLFSQRNYNIETLTVAPTEDETLSRLTVTTTGSDKVIEQITKQLNKLIEVVKLVDLTEGAHIERELMLVKLKATGSQRAEIKRTVDIFRGQIVDVTSSVYTVQLAGDSEKLERLHSGGGHFGCSGSCSHWCIWHCPGRKGAQPVRAAETNRKSWPRGVSTYNRGFSCRFITIRIAIFPSSRARKLPFSASAPRVTLMRVT